MCDEQPQPPRKEIGRVFQWNYERGYGLIEANQTNYFLHVTNLREPDRDVIATGDYVEFIPRLTPTRGPVAYSAAIVR